MLYFYLTWLQTYLSKRAASQPIRPACWHRSFFEWGGSKHRRRLLDRSLVGNDTAFESDVRVLAATSLVGDGLDSGHCRRHEQFPGGGAADCRPRRHAQIFGISAAWAVVSRYRSRIRWDRDRLYEYIRESWRSDRVLSRWGYAVQCGVPGVRRC